MGRPAKGEEMSAEFQNDRRCNRTSSSDHDELRFCRQHGQDRAPDGRLEEGQVVLVDGGSCPAGQIKKIIGGNHVKAGGWKNIERQRDCISR